jgi:spore coat polysaccharide biosynthesis predicted glycosyltransferase SpsG
MALGKPSVTVVVADNQLNQAIMAKELGATMIVHISSPSFFQDLVTAVQKLFASQEVRSNMSLAGINAIDGKGSERVTKCLVTGSV